MKRIIIFLENTKYIIKNFFKTKRIFIRVWWTNYIYWLPTILTSYHNRNDNALINFYVKREGQSYVGSKINISILWLGGIININYWWNIIKLNNYGNI